MFEDLTLDDLVIRSSSHTSFFGVYLATHAIHDGLCMCHASVGCKVKTQHHLVGHDGVRDAHVRMRYSQFIDEDLIQGSTAQLEEEIVAWSARQHPGVVVLDASTPISLQGQGMAGVIQRMEAATGADVVFVDARNYDADLYAGYSRTIGTLIERQRWTERRVRPDEVSIVGHVFDRYEPDQIANVAELRRLLGALGLKAPAVFLAGEPYARLGEVVHARTHVVLPYARAEVRALHKLGQSTVATGLPLGLSGTKAWLRAVAAAVDAGARAEAFIEHEAARLKPLYELARRQLERKRFAVFADAPRAAGIIATLREVGMVPACIGVLHKSPGGAADVRRSLQEWHGVDLPADVRWLEDPTPAAVAAVDLADCDLAIGTTIEREALARAGKPWVEMGFPSELRHFLYPAPTLGFQGALRVLEQAMGALERAVGR